MNNRRPSKPNLPNVPKPSKLLLQRGYAEPISFLAYRIPLLDHSINQYEIGPFLTASQTPNGFLTNMGMVRKGFGNVPLKDLTMERKRVEEFEESLCEDCGWVNLVLYSRVRRNVKSQFFPNRVVWRLGLATGLSHEFKPWANGLASLGLLSYSATIGLTLQLPCMLHTCASFGDMLVTSQSWDPIVRPYWVHTF